MTKLVEGLHYEIAVSGNGDTLWINGDDGSCWARFSKRWGIDVHRSQAMPEAQTECLYCTHQRASEEGWEIFRQQVLRHHGIVVEADVLSFP
ncbi:hypothetical protein [Paraburkholderia sp. 22B1P]|uniref:hypothetical protein n=1 Tax=Paraburkholderia sp. 22B1P TaxID=3080498 RepID=UPI00309156F9|nr:hypothetical protein PBP221_57100 [Paraburkholderia sp. 22B1P]